MCMGLTGAAPTISRHTNRKEKNEAVQVLEQAREEEFGMKIVMQAVSDDTSLRTF